MRDPIRSNCDDHISGFRREIGQLSDQDEFFGWFNNEESFAESQLSGAWDFSWHIATPLAPYLRRSPSGLTALEIGCGGGRLLAVAARFFPSVIGVDIHDRLDVVSQRLRDSGISNVELRQGDGRLLPCRDGEADVIYSFIVFQHLQHIDVLIGYLRETYRVLRPGGLAMLYAGRARTSGRATSRLGVWRDVLLERVRLPRGYAEQPAAVNSTNLRVSRAFMRAQARRIGFDLLSTTVSRRRVPHDTAHYGGQTGFLLRKRA